MLDTRIIRRLAYDGNYQRAIELLVEIIEKQQKEIEQRKKLNADIPHKCKEHLVFDHTIDTVLPFGNIDSSAVFKCEICGKEFREEELK